MDTLLEKILSTSDEQIQELSKHVMLGGGTPRPILVKGKGVRVTDSKGNSYIDCTSQSWALYLGYCHPEIINIIKEQSEILTHMHQGFGTLTRMHIADKLASIIPGDLNKVSFTVGGGPAIEGAMKIAIKNRPGSKEFVCLWDAYHGTTVGTAGASWITTQASGKFTGAAKFIPLTPPFIRVPNPYCYRCYFGCNPENCSMMCAEMLKLTLEKGVTGPAAGIILEPLQASAGQIPAPKKYLKRVREICDEYGVPLIFDEIQTYCRIGEFTAAEYYGVTPDLIALGKALGGGLPLAATVVSDKLEGFSPETEELHTFANNTLAQITALKQIEIIMRDNLLENTRNMGSYICENIKNMQKEFPEIGDIRGIGLHIGIEFVDDPNTKLPLDKETVAIRKKGIEKGIITGLGGVRKNVLKVKPPLIVNKAEADEILDILYSSIKEVLGDRKTTTVQA